jgi:dipeptidyl aminopeptidase/acylaminoacyl peptidase
MQSIKMIQENIIITSTVHHKPITADIRYISTKEKKPLILFVHGFKGFKDWGVFNLMADEFARKGFIFMKINLSHNGTTPEHLHDLIDLEAFANNNFTIELDDLKDCIDYLFSSSSIIPTDEVDLEQISLMGHSRGGGLVLLKAHEDERIHKVVTLAAINDLTKRWAQSVLDEWRANGVLYVENKRTNQKLPLHIQLYEDVVKNSERLSVPLAVKQMRQALLAFHGTDDETLPVAMAHEIKEWKPDTELVIFEKENHVFGAAHPWDQQNLPKAFQDIIKTSSDFILKA